MSKGTQRMQYQFQGRLVQVRYRKVKRAKGLRIQISSGNLVVVTGNLRTSFRTLEQFFLLHKKWAEQKLEHFHAFPNKTIKLGAADYKKKKEKARELILSRLAYWNQYYQFSWKQVTVRNQSTRWGSCSSAGTLSFHAGIIDLPKDLQDYLIVHELCHIQVMNHRHSFWKLVEKTLPEGKKLDTQLKKYTDTAMV